jgi:GntR family transcriptional regulator, arabinose operon transcriptional repressor
LYWKRLCIDKVLNMCYTCIMSLKDKDNPVPLYRRVYRHLKDRVEKGEYRNNEMLPSEHYLSEIFQVSRVTVRQALACLEKEKYITRKRGYGTEVVKPSISSRDKKAIAVLLVDVSRPFFGDILKGIQSRLDSRGYKLLLCDTGNLNEKEKGYLLRYKDVVAGFIVAPATGNCNHSHYGQLFAEKIPFVFIDRYLPEFNVPYVISDNIQGGYIATNHLLELGHRKICVLSEPAATSVLERIQGYEKALWKHGFTPDKNLIFHSKERGFETGYALIKKVLEENPDVTAAFCLNDDIAAGCLKRLMELNTAVPEEFSVVGFDNLDLTWKSHPSITTVNQPKFQMGQKAAEIIINKIEGGYETKKTQKASLPVELIIRESTGTAKSAVLERA